MCNTSALYLFVEGQLTFVFPSEERPRILSMAARITSLILESLVEPRHLQGIFAFERDIVAKAKATFTLDELVPLAAREFSITLSRDFVHATSKEELRVSVGKLITLLAIVPKNGKNTPKLR